MAIFAQINDENIVIQALVIDQGTEKQNHDWLTSNLGGTWIASYTQADVDAGLDTVKNGLPASVGMIYDPVKRRFYYPQPFPSWTLNENTLIWEAPKPYPADDKPFIWDEDLKDWAELSF